MPSGTGSNKDSNSTATKAFSSGHSITQPLKPTSSPSSPPLSGSSLLSTPLDFPSWMAVLDIIPGFKTAPPTYMISGLRWYKDRWTLAKHEFILLKVDRAGIDDFWLRIDRRPQKDASKMDLASSNAELDDSVGMCRDPARLWKESQSKVVVITEFEDPPHLGKLGDLLSVMEAESPKYQLYPKNCYFYSSVIYQRLFAMGGGRIVNGAPREFSLRLSPEARETIKKKMDALQPVAPAHEISQPQISEHESSIKSPIHEDSENSKEGSHADDEQKTSTAQEIGTEYVDSALPIVGGEGAVQPIETPQENISLPRASASRLYSGAFKFSSTPVQSTLFTHSWTMPVRMATSDLISHIGGARNAPIRLLVWRRDNRGARHEFLLLRVESSEQRTSWLRLDRRRDPDPTALQLISSISPPVDTVTVCADQSLLNESQHSTIKVLTEFTSPPSLEQLAVLLPMISEESRWYSPLQGNSSFFCSIIYELLFTMGGGANAVGTPSQFSLSFAAHVRGRIKSRVAASIASAHKSINTLASSSVEAPSLRDSMKASFASTHIPANSPVETDDTSVEKDSTSVKTLSIPSPPLVRGSTVTSTGLASWFRRQIRKLLQP